jgi:phosphate-selective porin OprO/OprP
MLQTRRPVAGTVPSCSTLIGTLALAIGLLAGAARAEEPPAPPAGDAPVQAPAEPPAEAQPAEPTIQEQIEALRQQLLVLERKAELAAEADAEKAKTAATVTASAKDGFSIKSNDGAFALKLRGYVQLDGRFFTGDEGDRAVDTLTIRRARPILEGTLYKRFAFRLMADFGSGATLLQDAYVDWTFAPTAVLRFGKFKPPFGLERLQSATETTFAERALATGLGPNRDAGIQLGGQVGGGRLEYAVGIFDGVPDGGSGDNDTSDDKDVVARLVASPWKGTPSDLSGLSFGIAATRGNQKGTVAAPGLAGYRTAGQQTPASGSFFGYRSDGTAAGTVIADGERFRLSPQASFFRGPLGLLGEYVQSRHEVRRGSATTDLTHSGWQVTGFWVLTGEDASYRWYAPARGFDPSAADESKRGRGGLAIAARYNAFRADDDSFPSYASSSAVQEARGWAIGLDWTLQRGTRLILDYEVTSFDGLGTPRPDEKLLITRAQVSW